MQRFITDERTGIRYELIGDYYYPCLTVEESSPLSKYGRLRKRYLREHKRVLYYTLLTSGKLYEHLAEIDTSARDMAEYLIKEMARKQGVTEELKARDMTIIHQTTEDDADDTVVPRFNSAGGNGENLIFIKEDEKSLSFGDNRIREAIEMYHAKLLILDPMSSYIGESCSMNNANETRAEFNHLIAVAKDTGCAIVIIAHMNKMRDTNPLYRTNGSIDIAGAARSILAITRTPNKEAPTERYLVQVKSNLAPTGSAILFEVSEKGVDFISEMEMTAEEAFQSLAPKIGRPNDKEVKAKAFLIEMLKDREMLSSDCEEKLEAAGFRKSTIKKAKKNAGVISRKKGFLWYWSLPMGDIPRE